MLQDIYLHADSSFINTVTCQELELPDNGNVSPREGFEGDIATYTCASGYMLLGTAARTCQESGSWSELAPICQVIQGRDYITLYTQVMRAQYAQWPQY